MKVKKDLSLIDDAIYFPRQVKINNKRCLFCEKCDLFIDKKKNMIHCDDC